MTGLVEAAQDFAAILTDVVNGTISSGIQFVVAPFDDPAGIAWVFPLGSTPVQPALIPVTAGVGRSDEPKLWLKVSCQVRLDSTQDHLAVQQSIYALVIDERTGRPVIRLEYDRDRGSEPGDESPGRYRRNAAHVQVHGSSEPLAYVQGLHGSGPLRDLAKFHIPVGGRRFRPSLEDFIEFLWTERLIPQLHDGWKGVINHHRSNWLTLQLRAAVRNDPRTAIAQLETMGYSVAAEESTPTGTVLSDEPGGGEPPHG